METSCSSSVLSLSGVVGGIGVPINIPRGYGDSIIPDRIPSIVSLERCGSGICSPGLVGEIEVSLGWIVMVFSTKNSSGLISNVGCQTRDGSVPVTLILGAGRSSKSRRLGLRIRPAGSGLR